VSRWLTGEGGERDARGKELNKEEKEGRREKRASDQVMVSRGGRRELGFYHHDI
jgi:hypothetical protein